MDRSLLSSLSLFTGLSEDDLDRFLERAHEVVVHAGCTVIREGDLDTAVYIILDGELEITRGVRDHEALIGIRRAGDVIGEMAPLTDEPRSATARARTRARLLVISGDDFRAVLNGSPTACQSFLRSIVKRLRSAESNLAHHQKMAAIGTLSAGLAHELNNPSAALQRVSTDLRHAIDAWQTLIPQVEHQQRTPEQRDLIEHLKRLMADQTRRPATDDPIARADREAEIDDWLAARRLERSWELAPQLAEQGWDRHDLDRISTVLSPDQLPSTLWWFAHGCVTYQLLDDLARSARSVTSIVGAMKSYSHLDQALVQEIDLHDGIEQTLAILGYRMGGIRVTRRYGSLPRIMAHASELNQVWTNIIDNAIDAVKGEGELVIETYQDGHHVVAAIEDDGPGIPAEIQPRLFEPFFTTKPPGHGTGLGLHISYQIVVEKHRGKLEVESRPGRTRFLVALPVDSSS